MRRTNKELDKSLSFWIKKVDKVFSQYIRLRDSINGQCQCITCYKIFPIEEVDAGHFMPRSRKATRYNEENVNAQCHSCNRFQNGLQYKYGIELDEKYGNGTAIELMEKSHKIKKFTVVELKELYEYYKEKVGELK